MALAAGQTLSFYEILGPLGSGAMGEVYRARDSRLGREVALKVLPAELALDPERLARFEREARVLAALQHPNVVTVHAVERADGVHFLTMELVDGDTLVGIVEEGGLPLEHLLPLARAIAAALEAAHAKGVTHRDLKPENVMVTGDGQVKVLDFGLAKLAAGEGSPIELPDSGSSTLTAEGRILGSVAYMSPEQVEGRPVDPRSDVFSLGILLYELATGERPFRGDSPAAILTAILRDAHRPARSLRASLPGGLDAVLARCLEKDPARRYSDAGALREALEGLHSRRRSVGRTGVVVAALALAVTGLLWAVRPAAHEAAATDDGASAAVRGPSVAVLPFAGPGDDPDADAFAEGLSDEIITTLSHYPDLAVLSRTQTKRYEGQAVDVRDVARELGGVRYVVEGGVRRAGDSLKVDAWLTDGRDGRQLWAADWVRDLTAADIFRLQEELTLQIVNAIAVGHGELSRAELARAGRRMPEDLDGYLCVLGTYRYWHAHTPENHAAARDCLEAAVRRDPDYADALALLAYVYAEEYHHQRNERPERYDALAKALETARRALQLDGSSQVAHGVMALIHSFQGDRDRFLAEARTTIDLNPGNADWLAVMSTAYAQFGYFEEGNDLVRRALALNPNPMPWLFQAYFLDHYYHGRHEEALAEALRVDMSDFRTPLYRAASYARLGDLERARAEAAPLREDPATDTLAEIRELLVRRNGNDEGLADSLLEGLRMAGFE